MQDNIFTIDEVEELVSELESALDMMEPYYKQCNAGSSAFELIERIKAKLPVTITETVPISCTLCNKSFALTKKKKVLRDFEQISLAHSHLSSFHGIDSHEERKKYISSPETVLKTFATRFEYDEYIKSKN